MKRLVSFFSVLFCLVMAGCTEKEKPLGPDDPNGSGGGVVTPQPQNPKLVSSVTVTTPDNYKEICSFEYDAEKVSKVILKSVEDGVEVGKPDEMIISWENDKVLLDVRSWNEDNYENGKIEIQLDKDGKAVKYAEKYSDYSADYNISYNPDGTLSNISESYGETIEYFWSGGNLISSKTYDSEEFMYSEYENNANIDLNWIISAGYGFDFAIPGFLDLFGKRSANYVVPILWNISAQQNERYPIPADGEYTFVKEETVCEESQVKTIYDFDEGNLVKVTASFPMYRVVTTYTVYCKILDYDSFRPGPDGQKLYDVYDSKILSEDSTKELSGYEDMLIEIGY